MRAANKQDAESEVDERGAAQRRRRARRMLKNQADAMPVVEAGRAPEVRVVDAELVAPAPRGGLVEVFQQPLPAAADRLAPAGPACTPPRCSAWLWSYIQPAMRFAVYYFVMGFILKLHEGTPYFALHLFTGIVVVHYFGETWSGGTRSIWQNKAPGQEDADAAGDLPGRLDAGGGVPHAARRSSSSCSCCLLAGWHLTWSAVGAGCSGC